MGGKQDGIPLVSHHERLSDVAHATGFWLGSPSCWGAWPTYWPQLHDKCGTVSFALQALPEAAHAYALAPLHLPQLRVSCFPPLLTRIDAIMAQLRQQGWMHHLARHSVACFLTRGDLWCRWGRRILHCWARPQQEVLAGNGLRACAQRRVHNCMHASHATVACQQLGLPNMVPHLVACSWEAGQAVFDKYLIDGDW